MAPRSRMRKVTVAEVRLWGKPVGAVAWNEDRQLAFFEYDKSFLETGLNIAPVTVPLRPGIFSFPALNRETFRGLPGLLADALPDRFGNALIDVWLERHGRAAADFSPVERLCYLGSRGMGALEFKPALRREPNEAAPLEVAELAALAQEILARRAEFKTGLRGKKAEALSRILQVGTSAGGARAKAVIAWNPVTQEVRSGQVPAPPGFEPWILKFDGVNDRELGESRGFGRIEYAYHIMARKAGITMTDCRVLEENGRAHFMTRRFDRDVRDDKIHVQSLCALGHYDFNLPGACSYEQTFALIQKLGIGHDAVRQMYRRMVFNLIARNQDDHTRNISFCMDRSGQWTLSPAYDVMWAYNSGGSWTNRHQMRVNGKQDGFVREDLLAAADQYGIRNAGAIIDEVGEAVAGWPRIAEENGISRAMADTIRKTHRMDLAKS
jgi:serine/threonine-protein kinase HipA